VFCGGGGRTQYVLDLCAVLAYVPLGLAGVQAEGSTEDRPTEEVATRYALEVQQRLRG
jgi:hypothetical protein